MKDRNGETEIATAEASYLEFDAGLRQFVRRRVANPDDAEDLLQEIYLRIHRHLGDLRAGEKLQSWVYQIARHAVIDHYRRQRVTSELPETLSWPEEPAPSAFQELAVSLQSMLKCLPEKDRQALQMVELEGMTQQALAQQLGISLSGAKSRVQRAREKLKSALLDCCHFEFDRLGQVAAYEPRCTTCAGEAQECEV